jgi:P22_AR N-terminal domain
MASATVHCHYKELTIRHFDISVPVVTVGRASYFPLRVLCERMGLAAPQKQIDKIRALEAEDSKWTGALRLLPVWTVKGERPAQCLHRRHLGRWLDSLDPDKCSITARGPLRRLQDELEAAADRFLFGSDAGDVVTDEHTCSCGKHHMKVNGEWLEE